jgi:hypothetical protein
MRTIHLALSTAVILASACTSDPPRDGAPSAPIGTTAPQDADNDELQIYATVIRHVVTKDLTRGTSPNVYVVNGVVTGAARPRIENIMRTPDRSFPPEITDGLKEELADLRTVRLIADPRRVLKGPRGQSMSDDDVIIVVGPIEREERRVLVPNGLWCNKCSQWLTYVLREVGGRWKITGTTGHAIVS